MIRRILAAAFAALATSIAFAQTLALSPAVVPLAGEAGQSVTQVLTLRNESDLPLDFVMEARDVVVRDGKRVFVEAGTLPDSIAASAVFVPRSVSVPPRSAASVSATFTLPHAMRHRAVVAHFRGTTLVKAGGGAARLAVGTLFTFTISDRISVLPAALEATPPSAAAGAQLRSRLFNDGTEPVVASGMAVILDQSGRLFGKVPFRNARLLPGETATLLAEYQGDLPSGSYRAVATLDIAGRPLTQVSTLTVQ